MFVHEPSPLYKQFFYTQFSSVEKPVIRTTGKMTVGSLIYFLGKEFRFLKYFFCVLTLIWFIDELRNYLVTRPSLTSISQTYLDNDHIPQILLCPSPAHDHQALLGLGYFSSLGQDFQKKIN